MFSIALGAAAVGFVHSLSPAHWAPITLLTRTRRWNRMQSLFGALVASSGHILVSVTLGLVGMRVETTFLQNNEELIERYSGGALILFGVLYALYAYKRHSACHGHEHHGPKPNADVNPYFFLFLLGFTPCIAALPLFLAAVPFGAAAVTVTLIAFSLGVISSLVIATLLVSYGLFKLDHPLLEHYGDVVTGAGIAIVGTYLVMFPH